MQIDIYEKEKGTNGDSNVVPSNPHMYMHLESHVFYMCMYNTFGEAKRLES